MRTLILLHGYGVRSFFWEPIKTFFESKFPQIYVPDLIMEDPTKLIATTKNYVQQIKNNHPDAEIFLVGHSLGAVVALLVANDLGPNVVKKVVLLAPMFGEQHVSFKSFTRFLIRYRLIPNLLSRPRFFSKNTPKQVQKRMFKQVVPESDALLDAVLADKIIYTDLIQGTLPQKSMILCSEYDKVVPVQQSLKLAEIIGSKVIQYPKERKIAHDDYITAPTIADEVSTTIVDFFKGQGWN